MKFYMKQKPFSWNSPFGIRDESDRDILTAKAEQRTDGARLTVQDQAGKPVAEISQQRMGWRSRFEITTNGRVAGFVVRRFSLAGHCFHFEGPGWTAEGTFETRDFKVFQNERLVMTVQKAPFTWGDSYALDVRSADDRIRAICLFLAIELALNADQTGI